MYIYVYLRNSIHLARPPQAASPHAAQMYLLTLALRRKTFLQDTLVLAHKDVRMRVFRTIKSAIGALKERHVYMHEQLQMTVPAEKEESGRGRSGVKKEKACDVVAKETPSSSPSTASSSLSRPLFCPHSLPTVSSVLKALDYVRGVVENDDDTSSLMLHLDQQIMQRIIESASSSASSSSAAASSTSASASASSVGDEAVSSLVAHTPVVFLVQLGELFNR